MDVAETGTGVPIRSKKTGVTPEDRNDTPTGTWEYVRRRLETPTPVSKRLLRLDLNLAWREDETLGVWINF